MMFVLNSHVTRKFIIVPEITYDVTHAFLDLFNKSICLVTAL